MKSKYSEAFDSLEADENIRRERTERVLAEYDGAAAQSAPPKSKGAAKTRLFAGKRGVALITALTVFVTAVAISVPIGLTMNRSGGLFEAISLLKGTFVDMNGVSAFGVWNAPDSVSESAYISDVMSVNQSSYTAAGDSDGTVADGEEILTGGGEESSAGNESPADDDREISTGDWSDDERYDWESDFDWDPTKSNVLIAIGDDGSISEVVYERTNGRGQVRQDVLGHAAKVYVSNGFTYVMYVNDEEWEHWNEGWYAQESLWPNGFYCHHEREQTVVIHNETGKVSALSDIFPQVNELSGATNYTMQIDPYKDDLIHIRPFYGNLKHQWYNVRFDEISQTIRYELVIDKELVADKSYNVFAVRHDKYGQQYILSRSVGYRDERVSAGIVNLPEHKISGNSLIFEERNGFHMGTDGQVYVFDNGVLKVYGDNFRLEPVSPDTEVTFEGIAESYTGDSLVALGNGISYTLNNGYLFSMFGEVWKVGADGSLSARDRLEGSFPRYANDAYLIGGEIIAFVDTSPFSILFEDQYSVNGRMVQLKFDGAAEEAPRAERINIIAASEINCSGTRIIVQQNKKPYTCERDETKYFSITVTDGTPIVEYVAYGRNGDMLGLVKPITAPLVQS